MFTKYYVINSIIFLFLGYIFWIKLSDTKSPQKDKNKNDNSISTISDGGSHSKLATKSSIKTKIKSAHSIHNDSLQTHKIVHHASAMNTSTLKIRDTKEVSHQEMLTDHQKKIIKELNKPYPALSKLLPAKWVPSKNRSQSNQIGLIGNSLSQAITHAQYEGFVRNKDYSFPVLNGLGHEVRLEIIQARIVGVRISFAPQASSADWMMLTTMLLGNRMNHTFMPSELFAQRIGQWTLPDQRTILYQLHTQKDPHHGDEHTLTSAYLRLGSPVQ